MTMFRIAFKTQEGDRFLICQFNGNAQSFLRRLGLNMFSEYLLECFDISPSHRFAPFFGISERFEMGIVDVMFGKGFAQTVLRKAWSTRSRDISNVNDTIDSSINQSVEKICERRALIADSENLSLHAGLSFLKESKRQRETSQQAPNIWLMIQKCHNMLDTLRGLFHRVCLPIPPINIRPKRHPALRRHRGEVRKIHRHLDRECDRLLGHL